ncbi:MAG: aminopeptidase P family protein [Rhodospirillaceae bacterium]|nr:aminopeptidase P family protein [Rhodospirillaceae bacterium]
MEYRDEVYFEAQPDREQPFTDEEFANRLTRIRQAMAKAKIDCLFLSSPESMYYLSGYVCMWYHTESPLEWSATNGIAVHVDHDRFIHFETEREAVVTRTFSCSKDTRYFPKDSYRDGIGFVADELKAEGWLKGNLGLEMYAMRPNRGVSDRFQAAFEEAGADVIDGSAILREVRWVKSPAEMACLTESARIATIGLQRAAEVLRPGVTELEVQGEITLALAKAGGELQAQMMPVLSGKKSLATHALATRRKMQVGETVALDVCGVHKRYHINAARTFSLGEPAADVKDVTDRAAAGMDVVRDCLRTNLPVRELNEKVKAHYDKEDLWTSRGWIGGYEMGIAFLSDWVGNFVYDPLSEKNADRLFEAGTAVNHEIQVFMPRHVGQFFMIESLLFEESGASLATPDVPYNLIVVE